MKTFNNILSSLKSTLLVTILLFTCISVWGEGRIEINTTNSGVTGSYADLEFDVSNVTFMTTQWCKNNNIQAKKSTTLSLYNYDAIPGNIARVIIYQTGTARAVTVSGSNYYSEEKAKEAGATYVEEDITQPTTAPRMEFNFTGKAFKYFYMSTPGNAVYMDSIVIYYAATTKLTTPASLVANTTKNTAALSWDAVTNAGSYKVNYKVSGAADWTAVSPSPTTNSANLTDLISNTAYVWQVIAVPSNTTLYAESDAASSNFQTSAITYTDFITECGSAPYVSVDPASLTGLGYVYGAASTEKTFIVAGGNLTQNVVVTPSTGFEVKIEDGNYGDKVELTPSEGAVNQVIYVRLASGKTVEDYNGSVTVSGADLQSEDYKTVTLSASVTPAQLSTPTITPSAEPASGKYWDPITVTLACETDGAALSYALNESEEYVTYTEPIDISATTTVKVKATKENYADNNTEATFTFGSVFANIDDWKTNRGSLVDNEQIKISNVSVVITSFTGKTSGTINFDGGSFYTDGKAHPTATVGGTLKGTDVMFTHKTFSGPSYQLRPSSWDVLTYVVTKNLSVLSADNGTISATPEGGTAIAEGENADIETGVVVTLAQNADDGYRFINWIVKDQSNNNVTVSENEGVYSFTMPNKNVTVSAVFSQKFTVSVTADASGKGSAAFSDAASSKQMVAGEQATIAATITDSQVDEFVNWTVSPADAVAFDNAYSTTTTITATASAATITANFRAIPTKYTATIAVNDANYGSATINGSSSSAQAAEGETMSLVASKNTGYRFVNWTASPSVDFVDAEAASTTFPMLGEAVSVTANFEVVAVSSVSLNKSELNLLIDEQETLTATVLPSDALDQTVTWASDKEGVATVVDGLVTAVGVGTAHITVTSTADPTKSATCTVTVPDIKTAVKSSFTSGDNTGTHAFTNTTDITFRPMKGNAGTAPAIPNGTTNLRLYQSGGYIVLGAAKGCKITKVQISTAAEYKSTTVGYSFSESSLATTGTSVAKSSTDFAIVNDIEQDTVVLICLGTDKDSRLELTNIKVTYKGQPITIDHIEVSGTYQTMFARWEAFNHNGAVVTAYYTDGETTANITNDAQFVAPDMTTAGAKSVTVNYGIYNTSYDITINEAELNSIALSGTYPTTFRVGDTFSHEGLKVTATLNNTHQEVVTDDAEVSAPDLSTAGKKTVNVSYTFNSITKTADYTINVIPASAIFYESFDTNNGTGGNDNQWSGNGVAANNIQSDNSDWTFANANGANKCAKFGSGSKQGSAQTPAISATGDFILTFKAGAWDGNSEATGLTISTTSGTLSETTLTMTKAAWTEYKVVLTGVTADFRITFAAGQASNNRFFLDEVMVKTVTTTRTLKEDEYSTICLEKAVPAGDYVGFNVWDIESATWNDTKLYSITIVEHTGDLVAGMPYIICGTAENQNCYIAETGTAVTAPVEEGNNGLFGKFEKTQLPADDGYYVISNGILYLCGSNSGIYDHRAYIKASEITDQSAQSAPAAVRRTIGGKNTPTMLENIFGNGEDIRKMIIDNQLIIIRGGKMYNAAGALVK